MNALKTLLPVAALAAGLAIAASANATVTIKLSETGFADFISASGVSSQSFNGAFGDFSANVVSGLTPPLPGILNSNANDVSTANAGTRVLDIFVTRSDIDGPMTGFLSTLRSNSITQGWSLQERTYVSSTNALFTGTQVSDYTFNSANNALGQNIASGLAVGAGPFSVTERYTITAINQGSSNATIDMFAVPEPTTWALMILGFGGVGAMVRGRRRQAMATA